jgi:hypothetical protein
MDSAKLDEISKINDEYLKRLKVIERELRKQNGLPIIQEEPVLPGEVVDPIERVLANKEKNLKMLDDFTKDLVEENNKIHELKAKIDGKPRCTFWSRFFCRG